MRRTVPFQPSPLPFTLWQRMGLSVSSFAISSFLKAVCSTCEMEYRNKAVFDSTLSIHGRTLLATWHEVLGLAIWRYRNSGFVTLTSYSFDGELAARISWRCGIAALRGSSSRGGAKALLALERAAKEDSTVGITVDGPKGPRREAKSGIAILAARTRLPILPNVFAISRLWRMRSWDRLMIPKPFATIVCAYADPIPPPQENTIEAIEQTRLQVEQSLNRLHDSLDQELG